MSLSSLRTRVKNNIQNNTGITSAQVDQWINDTQRRICRVHNFYWLESQATQDTTDEQDEVSLPTAGDTSWTDADSGTVKLYKDELSLHLVDYNNRRIPLIRVYKKDADAKFEYRDTDDVGTPCHYAIQRSKIKFYEAPDHADNNNTAWSMVLDYYGYLADLSGDSATNYLDANYPDALEFGGTSLAFRYLFEEEKADYWENKLKELVTEMIVESNRYQMGTIEEGMEPQAGSGVASRNHKYNLRAHYE